AYAEANRLAGEQGDSLGITMTTLHRRLNEGHLLASVDAKRSRLTVRRVLAGSRRDVLHFRAAQVLGMEQAVPTVPPDPMGQKQAENGTNSWDGSGAVPEKCPTKTAQNSQGTLPFGPNGTAGTSPRAYTSGGGGRSVREVI